MTFSRHVGIYNKYNFVIVYTPINSAMLYLIIAFACIERQEENDPHNLVLEGKAYSHFVNALRSPFTKTAYETSLKRYLNHLRLTKLDDLPLHTFVKLKRDKGAF
jgi:hypothetical protein